MKFIFQTMPAYGHLNPVLGVAKKLTNKGHHVIIYNLPNFKKKIVDAGAEFREPSIKIMEDLDFRILHNASHIAQLSLYATSLMLKPLVQIIEKEKPDCLIHDSLSLWSKIAGLYTKIPTVALVPSMAINVRVILSYTALLADDYRYILGHPFDFLRISWRYKKLYENLGLRPPLLTDIMANRESLNIVFTSKYFQPQADSFGQEYQFVGPIIYDRNENKPSGFDKEKSIVYVALGTVYNDNIPVYQTIINVLEKIKVPSYISIGKYIKPSQLGNIPDHIHIAPYFPQLEMLKKASLFISHAGMNSVNESLYFGVPLLMLPIIQEQKINASRVEQLGAGIYYRKQRIDIQEFGKKIHKLLTDTSYKKSAEYIGKTLMKAGGAEKATEYILNCCVPLGVA